MAPATADRPAGDWLLENGPGEIEQLFRAIVYHPAFPILIADDERNYRDASTGAGRLLGLSRDELIGQKIDNLADPAFKPQIAQLWQSFLEKGEQKGTLLLAGPEGTVREVEYTAKTNVLPVRHILALQGQDPTPRWALDYALFLLDRNGHIVRWYSGAVRIYGYREEEVAARHVSFLYPAEEHPNSAPQQELDRAAAQGHFGSEGWHVKKDGERFWANAITMALRSEDGQLQGFARVVRDFTSRHERDGKLRRSLSRMRSGPPVSTIPGVASGEFDRVTEVNDAFLELVGYTRVEMLGRVTPWPGLTPPEYAAHDDLAHEEGLRFGACTPYEKELLRKDGTRVRVLVGMAVLQLSPFQWITFVQDLRARDELESAGEDVGELKGEFGNIVGGSTALKRVQRQVELVAPTAANVLILGETGTGKELVAHATHRMSPRKNFPFITLNCAAIPTGLLESELFGYERGAFTGALSQKIGRFELAHRGTLFLDEVGDIPLDLQPKLLRALQEKAFERLGGTKTIPIDVRLIAATNRNLAQMMGEKLFRSDLYYRLNVFPIVTPPLRDRPEDIPVLARHFVKKYSLQMGRRIDRIPVETMRALVSWPWPGNVRELENFIERSVILSRGPSLRAPLSEIRPQALPAGSSITLEQMERDHIIRTLRDCGGVVTTAATRLGLHRTTLNAIMRRLGIFRKDL